MLFATCTTADCPELGIPKDVPPELNLQPDEHVLCGACGEPCTLSGPK